MGEVKNRSLRLDDDNYGWLSGLPGRTLNDALSEYRARLNGSESAEPVWGDGLTPLLELQKTFGDKLEEVLMLVQSLPDDTKTALREVVTELKGQKAPAATQEPTAPAPFNPRCVHHGDTFPAWNRNASLCPDCKREGHSNDPRDCPQCTERGTGAL
jgi:hypothetical protein